MRPTLTGRPCGLQALNANLQQLSQKAFVPRNAFSTARLAPNALVYVPSACAGSNRTVDGDAVTALTATAEATSCRLHVYYHGCRTSGTYAASYAMRLGLHQWAE